jgi:hypothetical protein
MADCSKELIMQYVKDTLVTPILTANYSGKSKVTRNACFDGGAYTPSNLLVYLIEEASNPTEGKDDSSNAYFETFPLHVVLRVNYPEDSNVEAEKISALMNNAEALLKVPFRDKTYVIDSRQVLFSISGSERELGINTIFNTISVNVEFISA